MTTVYFYMPDVNHAAGGVRAAYRMVDACNAAGVPAAVMHQARGFRPTWFDSSTPVVAAEDTPVRGDDVLVISELDAPRLLDAAPGVTKVVLNQHQYWTFVQGPVDYRHPDIATVIAVSEDGSRYLTFAFPGLEVHRLRYAVDARLFAPAQGPRTRTIAYLATKGAGPRNQVLQILGQRGRLTAWEWLPLSGLSQTEMAATLSRVALLATFSESEGFQMLLTEAMASGAAVVGFDAGGGREFMTEEAAWPVPAGDVIRFAERIEEVARAWDDDASVLADKTATARRLVGQRYTLEIEARDVVAAMQPAVAAAKSKSASGSHNVAQIPGKLDAVRTRLRAIAKAAVRG